MAPEGADVGKKWSISWRWMPTSVSLNKRQVSSEVSACSTSSDQTDTERSRQGRARDAVQRGREVGSWVLQTLWPCIQAGFCQGFI